LDAALTASAEAGSNASRRSDSKLIAVPAASRAVALIPAAPAVAVADVTDEEALFDLPDDCKDAAAPTVAGAPTGGAAAEVEYEDALFGLSHDDVDDDAEGEGEAEDEEEWLTEWINQADAPNGDAQADQLYASAATAAEPGAVEPVAPHSAQTVVAAPMSTAGVAAVASSCVPSPPSHPPSSAVRPSSGPVCPVCSHALGCDVGNAELNRHIDACLRKSTGADGNAKAAAAAKPKVADGQGKGKAQQAQPASKKRRHAATASGASAPPAAGVRTLDALFARRAPAATSPAAARGSAAATAGNDAHANGNAATPIELA